ncbi:MAG: histidine kinase [Gemmatimonadota bacterium]|jgi:signal transduction histidine kinase
MDEDRASHGWWPTAAVLGGWLAIGLVSSGLTYTVWRDEGLQIGWLRATATLLPYWLYWAPATLAIVALGRRWPIDARRWPRSLPVHVLAAIACGILHVALYVVLYKAVFPWPLAEQGGPPFLEFFGQMVRSRWQSELIAYGGILGAALAVRFARESEARKLAAAQLETQLANAQLEALRMQINPHFLFNTLQAISTLVDEDPAAARRMLALLGDLLRTVLDEGARTDVPLAVELAFVRRYLDIEQVRFADRLTVRFDIHPDAEPALVPTFLLQPIVENAIHHAVAPRSGPGRIDITARVRDGRLRLEVRDDGPGPGAQAVDGLGLATTRARLEKRFGTDQSFSFHAHAAGGGEAVIEIPATGT